jgi:Fic family protein
MIWYNQESLKLHPVELAARVHCDFVKIHPFTDGNGRTARLLMNLELMKNGFPAVVLPVSRWLEYYEILDKAHVHEDFEPFLRLTCSLIKESFRPYWRTLESGNQR